MSLCSFFNHDCRFCSHEQRIIPYAPLIEKNGRLVPGLVEHRKEVIGEMCNNISLWVKDLKYCPARWGLHRAHYGIRAEGCGGYPDSQKLPITIVFGQQTLEGVI